MMLDGVQRVVIVPGYGMAVAQAQHTVRELWRSCSRRRASTSSSPSTRSPAACRVT